jgi:hypothetical protein
MGDMDIDEVDTFLAEPKTLQGQFPEWKKNEARPGEHENTWVVADSLGISCGFGGLRQVAPFPASPLFTERCLSGG